MSVGKCAFGGFAFLVLFNEVASCKCQSCQSSALEKQASVTDNVSRCTVLWSHGSYRPQGCDKDGHHHFIHQRYREEMNGACVF